jgi:biotin carboxylase
MQKRVLFLGGAYAQIPIIQEAKNRGWYIITCDYLPENPGHKLANEYHNVSTTDFEGVLQIAQQVKPDFIIAYASDPAALTAAWVSEQLGLAGNSYESVKLLSEKDLFRNFLAHNSFNCPIIVTIAENNMNTESLERLGFPVIVKPTDSSGSKGVTRVENIEDIQQAIQYAFSFSRNKRIIIEEFIDNDIADIHGDGFVVDGKLVFTCLGDHIYKGQINPFNPTGTSWPSKLSETTIKQIKSELTKIIQLSGFKNGPINIEARINHKGEIFIMEIGPRNGGHFVPQAIKYATEFNMVSAQLDLMSNTKLNINSQTIIPSAYIAIHSEQDGILKGISLKEEIKPYIKEFHQYIQTGNPVQSFQGANAAIGIILLTFSSAKEMDYYISNMNQFVQIQIEE